METIEPLVETIEQKTIKRHETNSAVSCSAHGTVCFVPLRLK